MTKKLFLFFTAFEFINTEKIINIIIHIAEINE